MLQNTNHNTQIQTQLKSKRDQHAAGGALVPVGTNQQIPCYKACYTGGALVSVGTNDQPPCYKAYYTGSALVAVRTNKQNSML